MADALVHCATASLTGRPFLSPKIRLVFYIGNIFPDVAYKGLQSVLGLPTWAAEPTHTPIGILFLCLFTAMFFAQEDRPKCFAALFVGSLLHLLVDAFKDYMGRGVIATFFPFSFAHHGFGVYRPDDIIWLGLPSLLIILLVEGLGWLKRRRSSPGPTS